MRRALQGLGTLLAAGGLTVLGYGGWQLVGTDLAAAGPQEAMVEQYRATSSKAALSPPVAAKGGTPAPAARPKPIGSLIGVIEIPKLGVTRPIIEGVGTQELKDGVGRVPSSTLPPARGTLALAGHRVTYGRPFHDVDKLARGDMVYVELAGVRHAYRVTASRVVALTEVSVLESAPGVSRLVLISCHPKFSAEQRLIVFAELQAAGRS